MVKRNKGNKKGFTLVELIIVVAILGIIASIGAVKYGDIQKTAKENADNITASSIITAAEIAEQDKKLGNVSLDTLVTSGYLASKPKPQSGGTEFSVVKDDRGNFVVLKDGNLFYPKQ